MEKVKLPKEICEILDTIFKNESSKGDDARYYVLWYALQSVSYIYKVKKYEKLHEFNNSLEGTKKLTLAILHGYEPEETEEERKKREVKEKMLEFIGKENNGLLLINDYVDRLYNIAHGK